MNKVMLSLVLTLAFCVLIVLGIGFFQVMSDLLNNNLLVLGIGFGLLFLIVYSVVTNTEDELDQISVLEEDDENFI